MPFPFRFRGEKALERDLTQTQYTWVPYTGKIQGMGIQDCMFFNQLLKTLYVRFRGGYVS
ncbi:hypothetical protein SPFM6_00001 [Salmonella phage SPFM6]|nr:hypothetical protein SPFM6_00001 [Salmonella phage SPFM6]